VNREGPRAGELGKGTGGCEETQSRQANSDAGPAAPGRAGNRRPAKVFATDLGRRLREAREEKKIGLRGSSRGGGCVRELLIFADRDRQDGAIDQHPLAIVSELDALGQRDRLRCKEDAGLPSGTGAPEAQTVRLSAAEPGSPARPTRRVTRPAQHEPDLDQPRVRCQLATAGRLS